MKKIAFITNLLFISLICSAQNITTNLIPQDTVIISNWRGGGRYLESPLYIKNKDYIVFQYADTRKVLYPDMESFRIIQDGRDCAIAVDKDGVYYQGIFVKADTTKIKVVGEKYDYENRAYSYLWKNKNKVFKDTIALEGIDAESFLPIECFNGEYFKDENYVYYFDKKIEGSDGSTVNKTCGSICYDKNHVYVKGEIATYEGENLETVNLVLAKTKTKVVAVPSMKPIEGMDAASITRLSERYSMDKNHVYYGAVKLPIQKANLKNVKVWEQVNRAFVTDGINIYYRDAEYEATEKNLDAKTFGMLPHSDFTYDKNGVYEREWIEKKNKVIIIKFPFKYTDLVTPDNTFITDNSRYIVYKNQAYDPWDKKMYPDLSSPEIQLLKDGGLLDKQRKEPNDDSIKVTSLGYGYFLKDNAIYLYSQKLSGIEDIETFKPLNYSYAKDKNTVYLLHDSYGSSDNRYSLETISDSDPKTFEIGVLACDKDNVYFGTEPLVRSKDLELLAIYCGYRPGCGMDRTPSSNYFFLKNKDGFWIITVSNTTNIQYLGKAFNRKWNKVFNDFELVK